MNASDCELPMSHDHTYSKSCITHAASPVYIVLAQDLVAVVDTLAALETTNCVNPRAQGIARVIRVENVDAAASSVLSVLIDREDFDRVVNPRNSHGWFVGMAYLP